MDDGGFLEVGPRIGSLTDGEQRENETGWWCARRKTPWRRGHRPRLANDYMSEYINTFAKKEVEQNRLS